MRAGKNLKGLNALSELSAANELFSFPDYINIPLMGFVYAGKLRYQAQLPPAPLAAPALCTPGDSVTHFIDSFAGIINITTQQ